MKDISTIKNSTEIKKILRCAFDLTDLEAYDFAYNPRPSKRQKGKTKWSQSF